MLLDVHVRSRAPGGLCTSFCVRYRFDIEAVVQGRIVVFAESATIGSGFAAAGVVPAVCFCSVQAVTERETMVFDVACAVVGVLEKREKGPTGAKTLLCWETCKDNGKMRIL